jgi:hypothetical protein
LTAYPSSTIPSLGRTVRPCMTTRSLNGRQGFMSGFISSLRFL